LVELALRKLFIADKLSVSILTRVSVAVPWKVGKEMNEIADPVGPIFILISAASHQP
jgi:hypothetical protein